MSKTSPKYTPLEREYVEGCILSLLARRPASTVDLAPMIGLSSREIGWFIGELVKKKHIAEQSFRGKRRLWRLVSAPPPPPKAPRKPWRWKTKMAVDEEHERWMAYWQLPKAERMLREPPPIRSEG
ncbi:MAG TPA: hypothetical protein PK959_15810 [Candidatus Competibacteraceae bacterium]|nr:hypothetical protein [Candidatus Competibacteraceae bacterium]